MFTATPTRTVVWIFIRTDEESGHREEETREVRPRTERARGACPRLHALKIPEVRHRGSTVRNVAGITKLFRRLAVEAGGGAGGGNL